MVSALQWLDQRDAFLRSLQSTKVQSENSYTVALFGEFGRLLEVAGLGYGLVTSGKRRERQLGCDVVVVAGFSGYVKVALFEAKMPRFNRGNNSWDGAALSKRGGLQPRSGESRFNFQLRVQSLFLPPAAAFEVFYDDRPVGQRNAPFQTYGSSCVTHADAIAAGARFRRWTTARLTNSITTTMSVGQALATVLSCSAGSKVPLDGDGWFTLRGRQDTEGHHRVRLPVPGATPNFSDLEVEMALRTARNHLGVSGILVLDGNGCLFDANDAGRNRGVFDGANPAFGIGFDESSTG